MLRNHTINLELFQDRQRFSKQSSNATWGNSFSFAYDSRMYLKRGQVDLNEICLTYGVQTHEEKIKGLVKKTKGWVAMDKTVLPQGSHDRRAAQAANEC